MEIVNYKSKNSKLKLVSLNILLLNLVSIFLHLHILGLIFYIILRTIFTSKFLACLILSLDHNLLNCFIFYLFLLLWQFPSLLNFSLIRVYRVLPFPVARLNPTLIGHSLTFVGLIYVGLFN